MRACADGLVKVWQRIRTVRPVYRCGKRQDGHQRLDGRERGGRRTGLGLAIFPRAEISRSRRSLDEDVLSAGFSQRLFRRRSGEILQSPDSESTANMVESCVALYEITGKREWIDRAKFAADMLSTWMMSYDYQFPKGSDMDVPASTRRAASSPVRRTTTAPGLLHPLRRHASQALPRHRRQTLCRNVQGPVAQRRPVCRRAAQPAAPRPRHRHRTRAGFRLGREQHRPAQRPRYQHGVGNPYRAHVPGKSRHLPAHRRRHLSSWIMWRRRF